MPLVPIPGTSWASEGRGQARGQIPWIFRLAGHRGVIRRQNNSLRNPLRFRVDGARHEFGARGVVGPQNLPVSRSRPTRRSLQTSCGRSAFVGIGRDRRAIWRVAMFGCTRRHRQRGSAYQPGRRGIRVSSARWKAPTAVSTQWARREREEVKPLGSHCACQPELN
jgi:hypothetical protein